MDLVDRGKHIIALIAILVCSFLPLASSSIISSSFLTADAADSTEFFLYKGQDTPVPRSVEHLVVDSSVTSIEDEAFQGLENLKTVKLPHSLISIGNHAFNGCTNLASIKLGALHQLNYQILSNPSERLLSMVYQPCIN